MFEFWWVVAHPCHFFMHLFFTNYIFAINCRFVNFVLLLQDALCYNQLSMALQSCVPSPKTWAMYQTIVKILSPIVISYVLNQSCKHWLLGYALNFVIAKTREFHDEVDNVVVFDNMGGLKANVFDVEIT